MLLFVIMIKKYAKYRLSQKIGVNILGFSETAFFDVFLSLKSIYSSLRGYEQRTFNYVEGY